MTRLLCWTVLSAGALAGAVADIREDPPVASRPAAGVVRGRIVPAERVREISAVSRATGRRYKPLRFDRKTGSFTFARLPGDATYDVCLTTVAGEDIEGIDLSWHEARLVRLSGLRRRQLGLPPESRRAFTAEDAAELVRYVADLKDFTDVRRALYVRGTPLRAVMLVEVMRTRRFHARRGSEVIWRTELWYFRYRYGGWERLGNVERVLERHRIPEGRWRKITKVYYPALSAHVDEKGISRPVKFRIPERLDPARGRLAGTAPVQETRPIILGVRSPKAATAPATGPS